VIWNTAGAITMWLSAAVKIAAACESTTPLAGSCRELHPKVSQMNDLWEPASCAPEGVTVLTRISDANGVRNVQPLKRRGNLWFFPDDSVYVYYTPTHWAPCLDGHTSGAE
jgi:hypothetical protein